MKGLTHEVVLGVLQSHGVLATGAAGLVDVAGEGLELDVPDQVGDVRQGPVDLSRDVVDTLEGLEVIDEGRVRHEDAGDGGDRCRVVGDGGGVDLVE